MGWDALHWAALKGDVETVKSILEKRKGFVSPKEGISISL